MTRPIRVDLSGLIDITRDAVKGYTDGDDEMLRTLTEGTTEQQVKTYE